MAKLAWEAPDKCPVVNGYVVRIMTTVPEPARQRSASEPKTDADSGTAACDSEASAGHPPGQPTAKK